MNGAVIEEEGDEKLRPDTQPGRDEEHEDDSVMQHPLLQHQDGCDENHRADRQTATDGADGKTSVPQEPERAGRDQPGCSGSVGSSCSDSGRHECPICSELFDSGDHRKASLNCNHTLCHQCIDGIMKRAEGPGRLQCPFCRQTTPFLQWEIRRLQEESYSNRVYEPGPAPAVSPGPELQSAPASLLCCCARGRQLETSAHGDVCGCCRRPSGLRRRQLLVLCLSVLVLLFLVMLLLLIIYVVLPHIFMIVYFSGGLS